MSKLSLLKNKEIKSELISITGGCYATQKYCKAQCGATIKDGSVTDHVAAASLSAEDSF